MKLPEALDLINPAVKTQKAYHLERREVPVKLNQNENPFDWPQSIKEEIGKFCVDRPWNRYPPFIPDELRAQLGEYIGLPAECIIAGNGSNEMLLVLLLALAKKDEPVILCQPTFTVYHLLAEGVGAGSETVFLDSALQFDLDAMLAASAQRPRAPFIICSPNNPTGTELDETQLRKILAAHKGFLILDQAYVEFGGFSAVPLVNEHPNLIVTRTFSKAFAGAGLRIGYMAGQAEVIAQINKIKLPYNINFFSEYVARTALTHRGELSAGIDLLIRERDTLAAFLAELPCTVFPSSANFILIRTDRKQEIFETLLADGILVRDVASYPKLENCLRISIGSPEENNLLKQSLRRLFGR
ncbi:MAG: histidinol-phosphate transaminase [Chitinispirillaceae bacterium]|nr:histidinol-phosphate transaminase [Chitinispirillaceae bacterium]